MVLRYGDITAVDRVSFEVRPGEIMALVGPSGCGKTSLLKSIAGLEPIDFGHISFDGNRIDAVAPHRRNVGMVFQNYALFPHKRVRENIAFGLRMHGIADPGGKRVADVLKLLHIGHLAEVWPDQLSGGQQQRVALARTLVLEPKVLLLDEPLSALDRQLRDDMRTELRMLAKTVGITTIIVTHDQDEAMAMADRVAVMRHGKLEQIGRPEDLYNAPETAFVAGFVGRINHFRAVCAGAEDEGVTARFPSGAELHLPFKGTLPAKGAALDILARSEAISVLAEGKGHITATVRDSHFMGSFVELLLDTEAGDPTRIACRPADDLPEPGQSCQLHLASPGVFAFAA
ncbi:ABC transporter ATP-binding protein [Salinihabitans flavidus]|uniref:ABC transporter ATP-binding protein n=1 Tax=Salinihabitans flavidus TaxID=569882 RepID=UPI0015874A6F|nr:ABC transporter ATP-binding protein [Salinihabitans flavidus]